MNKNHNAISLIDNLGRKATYMRLSVTDRCNFNCVYCVGGKRRPFIPHADILRYEEFIRLIAIGQSLGIQKVRITGGEPFARKGLLAFLASIRERFPNLRLCITSNGALLGPYLDEFKNIGIASFNISLDSFDKAAFAKITGRDNLGLVLDNIEGLLARGERVKINAVALRGLTDMQMPIFIKAINKYPVDLRFIEFMPMGGNTAWNRANFISCDTLRQEAAKHALLTEERGGADCYLAGPAKMYKVEGAKGRLGFISAVSEHFCALCNRLRVTCDGHVRACLFSDKQAHLAPMLRIAKICDAHIAKALLGIMARKPLGNKLLESSETKAVAEEQMVGIGG